MSLINRFEDHMSFFSTLDESERSTLIDLVELKDYQPNQQIIGSGSLGDSIFLIYSGLVNVKMRHPDKTIYQMKSGDFFGEIAFFAGTKRSADVVTIDDSIIGEITKDSLDQYILERPSVGCKILYHMAEGLARRVVNSNHEVHRLNSHLTNYRPSIEPYER